MPNGLLDQWQVTDAPKGAPRAVSGGLLDQWEVVGYSDLPPGAQVVNYSDLPEGARVVSVPVDPLTRQTQAAARAAGAPTGPAPLPKSMQPAPELYGSSGAPVRVPANINQAWESQAARATRLGAEENRAMQSPTPVTDAASTILPIIGAQQAIEQIGLRALAKEAGRGLLKSAAGATIGAGAGGGVGSMVGHPKEGAQIGATIGGVAAPFVPGKHFANLPLGRIVATPEEYAENLAEIKSAQRTADIKAGLREEQPPLPVRAYAEMQEDLASRGGVKPSPFANLQSTSPESVRALPPVVPREPEAGPLGRVTSTGPEAKIVPRNAPKPTKGLIVEPGSPPPHVEGSYWNFREPVLREAVLSGDRDAAIVYKQRFGTLPPGARYVTDVGTFANRGLYESGKR
jgi:hypothetical protein